MTSANDGDTSVVDDDWDLVPKAKGDADETGPPFVRSASGAPPSAPAARVSVDAPSRSLPSVAENRLPLSREPSIPGPDASAGADKPMGPIGRSRAESPPESFERGDVIEPAAAPPPAARTDATDSGPALGRRIALAAVFVGVCAFVAIRVQAVMAPQAGDRLDAPSGAAAPRGAIATTPAAIATIPTAAAATPATEGAAPSSTSAATVSSATELHPRQATLKEFDSRAARAALNALAPTLVDCRIQKGRSGNVEVTFERDGHVSSAKPLDVYVGTFGGNCVARHLKAARLPPFSGQATAYRHVFVIPQ
jgi:hypothetical protein